MSKVIVSTALWWIVESSIQQLVEATNNSTDDSSDSSGNDLSPGVIAAITIGSLAGVAMVAVMTAGIISCCTKKITKKTVINKDGSQETNETEEIGNGDVAIALTGVAKNAISEIGDVFALVTHISATKTVTTTNLAPDQSSLLSPSNQNKQQQDQRSISQTTVQVVDINATVLAIDSDLSNGPSDGDVVAAYGRRVIEDQLALDRINLLFAQHQTSSSPSSPSIASPQSQAPVQAILAQKTSDIHAIEVHTTPDSSGSAAILHQTAVDVHAETTVIGDPLHISAQHT